MKRGFTMSEVLAVMAVMLILSGAAVPTGMRFANGLKQLSLTRSAETVYMTAQRNLIAAKVSGRLSPDNITLVDGKDYAVVASSGSEANKDLILPERTVSAQLYNANWRILYNKDYLVVMAFYWEDDAITQEQVENYDSGLASMGKVGYYGSIAD